MAIRIITDTAADFDAGEAEFYGVEEIELPVSFDGQQECVQDKRTFWEKLTAGGVSHTAQPSPQVWENLFADAQKKGDEIVCILISSALSGTFSTAKAVRERLGAAGVYIVDSRAASGAEKMIVLEACRLRGQGKSAAEIFAAVESFKRRVRLFAMVDTLEYLARGGRVSAPLAAIGNFLKIKPLVTFTDGGAVTVFAKTLGVPPAIRKLCEKLREKKLSADYPVLPLYSGSRKNIDALLKKAEGEECVFSERLEIGPTIGSHIGPDGCGLVFGTEE